MYQLFDRIKDYYDDSPLEAVDLNGFFAEQAVLVDRLFSMGWSNKKIYK